MKEIEKKVDTSVWVTTETLKEELKKCFSDMDARFSKYDAYMMASEMMLNSEDFKDANDYIMFAQKLVHDLESMQTDIYYLQKSINECIKFLFVKDTLERYKNEE